MIGQLLFDFLYWVAIVAVSVSLVVALICFVLIPVKEWLAACRDCRRLARELETCLDKLLGGSPDDRRTV